MEGKGEFWRTLLCTFVGIFLLGLWPATAWGQVPAYHSTEGESFDVGSSKGVSTSWENDQSVTLGWIHDGDYACYKERSFTQGVSALRLRMAKIIHDTVEVQVRLDKPDGSLLVEFSLSDATGKEWTDYEIGSVKISRQVSGVHDVYFVFHSLEKQEDLLHIDWFQFVEAGQEEPYLPPEGLIFADELGVKYRVLKGGRTCELYRVPSSAEILDTMDTVSLIGSYDSGEVQVELQVVKVAKEAAKNCKNLQVAYFGGYVNAVAKNAFKGCKKLKMLVFRSNQISSKVKASAFYDIKKKAKVIAPKDSLAALKKTFQADKKTRAKKFKYQVYEAMG